MDERTKVGVVSREELLSQDGLSFLKKLAAGEYPRAPMADTLGFDLIEVEHGRAVFAGTPDRRSYNPINVVHGGWAATVLDSALGCAVQSTAAKGEAYTTLELKVNLVRAITAETGRMTAEARVVHRGRSIGTAEAYLRDAAGKLYAHATTTCMIFPAQGG